MADDNLKLQSMIENISTRIAEEVYQKLGTRYNVASVPTHTHDGVDTIQIPDRNILSAEKNGSGFVFDTSETIVIRGLNLSNMKRITFLGFAANNADGSPATLRAIINGVAQFGRCYQFSGEGTGTITVSTDKPGTPFMQMSNAMYVDSGTLSNNRVSISGTEIANAVNNSGSSVVSLTLDSYTDNSMTFTCTLGSNWKLQGNIIID